MKSLVGIASLAVVCVLQFTVDVQAGSRRRCCCCPPANGAATAAAAGAAVTPAAPAAAAGGTLTGDINPGVGTAVLPTAPGVGGPITSLVGDINPSLLNGTNPGTVGTTPPAGQAQGLWNPADLSQTYTWKQIALLQEHLRITKPGIKGFDLSEATLQTVLVVPDAP